MFGYYLELAFRSLRRSLGLTVLMVLAIGFGVAASMSTYAVFRAMSGDPIPWKSSKLFFPQIDVWGPASRQGGQPGDGLPADMTYIDAMALMRQHRAAQQTAMYPILPTVYPDDPAEKSRAVPGHAVYAAFFAMLDVPFRYGSGWSSADDGHRARVAVIDSQLNQRLFGGANSVGKAIRLDGHSYRITGVLADWHPQPQFYDLANSNAFGPADQVFVPFATAVDQQLPTNGGMGCGQALPGPGFAGVLSSSCVWVAYMVELDDAAQVASYRSYLNGYAREQQQAGRFSWPPNTQLRDLSRWMDQMGVVPPESKVSLVVSFCLLLVCMVNAVGLLLAKFLRRSNEIGVRRALGASRAAIASQFAVEAGVVGLAGGVLGLLLTWLGVAWMHGVLPRQIAVLTRIDPSLLGQTLLLAIAATLLAGLYPILRATHVRPAMQLKID